MVDINIHSSGHKKMEPETLLDADSLDNQYHDEAETKTNTPGKQVVDPDD